MTGDAHGLLLLIVVLTQIYAKLGAMSCPRRQTSNRRGTRTNKGRLEYRIIRFRG
jgi:hypothetical protein